MTRGAAWPENLDPRDPWADRPQVDLDLAHELHQRRRGAAALPRPDFDRGVAALLARLTEIRIGQVATPDPVFDELVERLALGEPTWVDEHRPERPESLPDVATLARLSSDVAPALGNDAPDRILGPWALDLDVRRPRDREILHAAVAAAGFAPTEDEKWGRSALGRWARHKPRPLTPLRVGIHALRSTPLAPWRIGAIEPAGWHLTPLLPMHPRHVPDTPVAVPEWVTVDGGGGIGDTLMARVAYPLTGWQAGCAFAVRGVPPARLLETTLTLLVVQERLFFIHPRIEDALRSRGHELLRRVHEWAWLQAASRRAPPASP